MSKLNPNTSKFRPKQNSAVAAEVQITKLWRIMKANTAWKVSVFGAFLVCICPHLDWIRSILFLRIHSEYEKIGTRKLRMRTLLRQWNFLLSSNISYYSCQIEGAFQELKINLLNLLELWDRWEIGWFKELVPRL